MERPVRVLQVITGMGSGGAEMLLMNMYRNMDHSKIVFDFLVQSDENLYKEELDSYGSRFWKIPSYYRHPLKNHSELKKVLAQGYSIIHVHANALLYIAPILAAEKAGIPCRIIHSHSSFMCYKWALPYHNFNKRRLGEHATHRFACSDSAGKWMFEEDYTIVPNGIDLRNFSFQPKLRAVYRQRLNIPDDELVIGQIGRLSDAKNQSFSLDVFAKVLDKKSNCRLLFVGEGNKQEELRNKARMLGLEDRVFFLGVRTDVSGLINAFDVMLFPSLYEGLGIVAIEAQANGLPILCSSAVPQEAIIANNAHRLSLSSGVDIWASSLLSIDLSRIDSIHALRDAGYDIHAVARRLQDFYLRAAKGGL